MSKKLRFLAGFCLLLCASLSWAAMTVEQAFLRCKADFSQDALKRHACFDSITTPALDLSLKQDMTMEEAGEQLKSDNNHPKLAVKDDAAPQKPLTYIERKWRLTSEGDWDITDLETHRLNYLVMTHSDNPNDIPQSPTRPNSQDRALRNTDLKFQLSLKTELMNNLPIIKELPFVTSSRLWMAYTQQSYWQVFNSQQSRPMREHNYAPEAILSLGVDNKQHDERVWFLPRMVNLGVIHESNGRSKPISRSWNRTYLEGAWELNDDVTLSVRPWWRIPENKDKDDNPDISRYLGYGDVSLHWDNLFKNTSINLLVRNNLRSNGRGYVNLDVQYHPFTRSKVKLLGKISSGYGESLVDYNQSQTLVGVGVSVGE